MAPSSPQRARPGLRFILVAAITGPLLIGVFLTANLMLRQTQGAVRTVAADLDREIAESVAERLRTTLAVPHHINQGNADALLAGLLPMSQPSVLEPHFLRQLKRFPTTSCVQFGRGDGWFVGVERTHGGFAAETTEPDGTGKGVYDLDDEGQRASIQRAVVTGYDARTRPWFRAAVDAGEPAWSEIYQFSSREAVRLGVTAVQPVYREQALIGVVGTDITLSHLSQLLRSPRLGPGARVFVLEPDGHLVASSGMADPFTVDADGNGHRLRATEVSDRWTRAAAADLTHPIVMDHGDRATVHVTRLRDGRGLDWQIVVVTPEARFLAVLEAHAWNAMLLTLVILLCGGAVAVVIANRIGEPIQALAGVAQQVAAGRWDDPLPEGRTREVAQLSSAFQAMRDQLRNKQAILERTLETRTEAMEAAREASRAKSAFLANMSHELRTPLNAILGYSEMLYDDLESEEHHDDLSRILASGHHLLGLIDQLLELSRLEAKGFSASVEEVSIDRVIEDVVTLCRPAIDDQDNTLSVRISGVPPTMTTDPLLVKQILTNLIGNAAKFTDRGTIQLVVATEGRGIVFKVTDSGIGIPASQTTRIFDAFSQANEASTREHGGTGLGLAIARRTAELLGGGITVESTEGQGSTFALWLPRTAPTTPAA